jgi:hypothetical protein
MLTREKKNKGAKRESETGNIAAATSTWSIETSSHDFDQSLSDMSLASEELSLDCITDDNLKKEEWSVVVNRHTLKDEKGRHDSQNNEYSLVDDLIIHQNDRMIAGQLVSQKNNQTNVRLDHFLLSTKNMSIDNKGNNGNEGNHKFSAEKCSKPTFLSSYYEQNNQESCGKNNPKNQKTVFWVTLSFCLISVTLLYSSFHFAHEMRAWRRKAINLENEVTRLKDEIDHLKRWQYDNESSEKCDYRFSVKNSWVEGDVRVSLGERGAEVSDAFWSTYDDFTNSLAVFYNDVKEELNTFQTGHKPKNGEVRSSEMQNLEQIIDPFDAYKKISREFIQGTHNTLSAASLIFTAKKD